jgi:hypothetical protein
MPTPNPAPTPAPTATPTPTPGPSLTDDLLSHLPNPPNLADLKELKDRVVVKAHELGTEYYILKQIENAEVLLKQAKENEKAAQKAAEKAPSAKFAAAWKAYEDARQKRKDAEGALAEAKFMK